MFVNNGEVGGEVVVIENLNKIWVVFLKSNSNFRI